MYVVGNWVKSITIKNYPYQQIMNMKIVAEGTWLLCTDHTTLPEELTLPRNRDNFCFFFYS